MAFLQQGIMPDTSPRPIAPHSPTAIPNPHQRPETSSYAQRSRRQLGLFFAGAGFFAISSMITRRSLVRRYKATVPTFYQPNNRPIEVNGAMEALEALNLATINVLSLGMMVSGGLLYAFDISSLDDVRRRARSKIGADGIRTDQDIEEEIEQWFTTVFEKRRKEESKDNSGNQDKGKSSKEKTEKS